MKPWLDRLKNEYCELLTRYNKLCDALDCDRIDTDAEGLYLLKRQRYVMSCYLDILHRRLERAGVNMECK